jgi:hypothetical protein
MNGFERIRDMVNEIADLAILALFVVAGIIFFVPGIQKRWAYAAAAIVLGSVLGLAARRFGLADGLDLLALLLGIAAGPVTVAKMQGKTIIEAIEEIQSVRLSRPRPPPEPADPPADDTPPPAA